MQGVPGCGVRPGARGPALHHSSNKADPFPVPFVPPAPSPAARPGVARGRLGRGVGLSFLPPAHPQHPQPPAGGPGQPDGETTRWGPWARARRSRPRSHVVLRAESRESTEPEVCPQEQGTLRPGVPSAAPASPGASAVPPRSRVGLWSA